MRHILFIYESKHPIEVHDGLYEALELLKKDFTITKFNLAGATPNRHENYDIILAWGAFGSFVHTYVLNNFPETKKALCIGGTANPPESMGLWDVIFYETYWHYHTTLKETGHKNLWHAFGYNALAYRDTHQFRFIDYLSVGAFSLWKNQRLIKKKSGVRMVIGEVQKGNMEESLGIIAELLEGGVGVMDMVHESTLSCFYNSSKVLFMPSDLHGGGERSVLEARACGCDIEVSPSNHKLVELIDCELFDHHYYYSQLKQGLESIL